MKLIPLSPNVLVNPDFISRIEQKKVAKEMVTFVCVEGKEYVLQTSLKEFYQDLGIKEQSSGGQYFAG